MTAWYGYFVNTTICCIASFFLTYIMLADFEIYVIDIHGRMI